ncbi:MAG: CoA-binding protein [Cycloclasticus sp.]|nr:CoA-binding protein [Cycloclasticus sp.]
MSTLNALFEARSVAIVGASDNPHKLGGRPVAYMKRLGYKGKIIPVNPTSKMVQGLPAIASLADLKEPVDLAVLATPEAMVEGIVKTGLDNGIKNFVVFASGYAEIDEQGLAKQRQLEALFEGTDARLLGPNCLGFINTKTQLIASFTTAMEANPLKLGRLSFAGHSGALGAYWLDKTIRADIGVSKWISSGNESNVDIANIVEYLANDPDTQVISLYIEAIRNPARFEEALTLAKQNNKIVVALKGGKTAAGARATQAHTASNTLNGVDYKTIFNRTGVIEVDSLSEMIKQCQYGLSGLTLKGNRVGVISISGGAGVMLSDQLTANGLNVNDFSASLRDLVRPLLSPHSTTQNPVDLTAAMVAQPTMLGDVATTMIESNEYDALVIFMGLMDSIADSITRSLLALDKSVDCPVFLIWMGGKAECIKQLSKTNIIVFDDIPELVSLIARSKPGC